MSIDDSVPITQDFNSHGDAANTLGFLHNIGNPMVLKLLSKGYVFDIAPSIEFDGIDENGEFINPRLIEVSIITTSARKMDMKDFERRDVYEVLKPFGMHREGDYRVTIAGAKEIAYLDRVKENEAEKTTTYEPAVMQTDNKEFLRHIGTMTPDEVLKLKIHNRRVFP